MPVRKAVFVNMNHDQELFRDPTRPLEERVQDLIARLTLPEKISQMAHSAAAIPRLGIPAYNFWGEALHGVGRNGRATVFPQAIGMAATWNPKLIKNISNAIADEARAKYHATMRRRGDTLIYQGLTFWSPNVNIFRDPRWGRGQETWGEDPYLTGEMGLAYVQGLQGDDPRYLKAAACAKHYAVHSGPEIDRHSFNADVSLRDMYDTYLPAFRKLVVEGNVEAVMGAYNRTNGEACCASPTLLGRILRDDWGFKGHVVSDCGALADIHNYHKLTADAVETAALALKEGCDIGCDCVYTDHLAEAIERGLVSEQELDTALARTLATRFKLGMFDPDELVPFADTPLSVVACDEHKQLAQEAAAQSIVLLKNRNNVLPISSEIRSLCVIGPTAASIDVLLGNYYGISDSFVTILEGIVGRVPADVKVEYRVGTQLTVGSTNEVDYALNVAVTSDVTIACMGIAPQLEGEEGDAVLSKIAGDRADIGLPEAQVNYIKKMAYEGAKIVLVVTGGSPIALTEIEDLVEAIVFVWYPGQLGGKAVAEVLFGDRAPSGKLPLTFPRSLEQLPPFEEYSMQGRTYRYMSEAPLYPFGFGLSYTNFAYSNLQLSRSQIEPGQPLELSWTLTNTGTIDADEVAQIYLSDLEASVPVPFHKLVGFERVHVPAGQSIEQRFVITPQMLAFIDEQGASQIESGDFRVTIGGSSPGARSSELGASEPVSALFTLL